MKRILSLCVAAAMLATLFTAAPAFAASTVLTASDVKSFGANNEILPSAAIPDEVLVASCQAGWSGATTFTDTDGTVTTVPSLSGTTFGNARNTVVAFTLPAGTTSEGLKSVKLSVTVKTIKQVTANNRLAVYGHSLSTPWAGTTITKETFGASSTVSILSEEEMPLLGLTDAITAGNQTADSSSNQTISLSSNKLLLYVRNMIDAGMSELTFQYAMSLGGAWLYSLNTTTEAYKPTLELSFGSEANASLNYVCAGDSIGTKALSNTWLNEQYSVSEDDAPLSMEIGDKLYVRRNQGEITITPETEQQAFDIEYIESSYRTIVVKTASDTGVTLAEDILIENIPAFTSYTYTGAYDLILQHQGTYYGFSKDDTVFTIDVTQGENIITLVYKESVVTESEIIAQEGAACWFGDPRSLRYENTEMGIDATYIGYIDVHGAIKATQYDHTTDTVSEVLIRSNFQPDDHNSPTWLALPDGRIMVFYSRHTDEARFFYRVSAKAGDITTLGEEKILAMANNTTYPNPYILSSDPNHIYLCWRGINWHPTIGRLTMPDANGDCTFDWGPKQIVSSTIQGSGCRPYAKYTSDGESKIYMTYSATHPDNVNPTCIYFSYIDITDLTVRDINGAVKASLDSAPFTVTGYETDTAYVVDDSTTSQRGWVWDIALDGTKPVIAMVRISSDKQQHDYYCATYNEGVWTKTHLADAGKYFHQTRGVEQCYSGGMSINHANPREIYGSEPVDGIYGEVYEIAKYTLSEDYSAVETTEYITQNSQKNNVRPVYTINARQDGEMALTWMRGDYYYWIVNSTYKMGFPTSMMTNTTLPRESNPDTSSDRVFGDALKYDFAGEGKTLEASVPEGSFTASFYVYFDSTYASGTVFKAGNVSLGVERTTADNTGDTFGYGDLATVIPYVEIGTERYYSVNRLSDSDWMQSYGSTTSGAKGTDNMGWINYTIVYDAAEGALRTYVNGLIDQYIETTAANASGDVAMGEISGSMASTYLYSSALSQDAVKAIAAQTDLDAIIETSAYEVLTLPTQTMRNLTLPETAEDGSEIVWQTENADVISSSGVITRAAVDTQVNLTATINFPTIGEKVKDFTVTVLARNSVEDDMYVHLAFEDADVYTENGATYVRDLSGQGNDALICGSAQVQDGFLDLTQNVATAFETNGYANITGDVLAGIYSYSVMTKLNLSSITTQPRIYDIGTDNQHSMFCRASAFGAGIKNSSTQIESANTLPPTNEDIYVTVTYDASTKVTSIYLNETLVGSGVTITHVPYQLGTGYTRNYIGRTQWWDSAYAYENGDLVGKIYDFRMYTSALSADDVSAIINNVLPAEPTVSVTENTLAISGTELCGSVSIGIENSDAASAEVFLCAYNGDMLVSLERKTAAIAEGAAAVDFADVSIEGATSAKILIWNTVETVNPLFNALTVF
ncbi:MAG: BNR-4 repeat-containing protein [Clostridia bacterium]|nr:BNR-4 repeat-containing protein [Clostridia bacterium]